MNIHEYQAKDILRAHGIPVPPGEVATTPQQAEEIAALYGGMVVVKAQVHAGGRGKARAQQDRRLWGSIIGSSEVPHFAPFDTERQTSTHCFLSACLTDRG